MALKVVESKLVPATLAEQWDSKDDMLLAGLRNYQLSIRQGKGYR